VRIKEIQALRAIASLLVVIYHAKLVKGGYIGVDIFYVISGYLITGLLLREMEKMESFSFKAFYLRRIKRLLPASFVVLIATAVISWILFPPTLRQELGKGIGAAGIYISNFLFALWQMDYQNLNAIPPVVIHYWSLAVEEQFYLFWPFIIFILFRYGGRKLVGRGILAITALSFIWSYFLTSTSPIWAFYSLPTRAWELGVGALLLFVPRYRSLRNLLAIVALTLIMYGSFTFNDSTPFPGTAALVPVIATAIAISTIGSWPKLLKGISNLRFVQWLGEISYPLYLWHWPLLVIPAVYLGRGLHIFERAICIAFTLYFADRTHVWIEEPLRHISLSPKRITRLAVAATTLSVATGLLIYSTYSDTISIPNGQKVNLAQILEKPVVYTDGCHVNNGETISGNCTYGSKGSPKKIVLFGDSHAAQWFPALEKLALSRNFELISLTKSACPGPAVLKVDTGAYKNADCSSWRENSYKRIAKIHPEAVIVSGMQHFELPKGIANRGSWWREGEAKTLSHLIGTSPHLVYITDTPHPQRDIPSCLASRRASQCNSTQPSLPYTISGFTNIDPTSWLCSDSCPAIVEGTVAYRDASHISVAMSRKLSPKLLAALQTAGVGF
jgi:peptidoglycan/LPS O-acetylase OafA/YrhL